MNPASERRLVDKLKADDIGMMQFLSRKAALKLETKGLRRSGPSALSICKKSYGFTDRTAKAVLPKMERIAEQVLQQRNLIPKREVVQ